MKKLLIPFFLLFVISACGTETEPDFDPPAPQPQPQPEPPADKRAQYTVTLTLTDSSREIELRFGQHGNPTSQDEQMPPAPPEGTLHAFFTKGEKDYWRDFRSENSEAEKWDFTYQTGTNGTVLLKWNVQTTRFPGTLSLVNPKDDSSIKMEATGEFELPSTATGSLIFEYKINN